MTALGNSIEHQLYIKVIVFYLSAHTWTHEPKCTSARAHTHTHSNPSGDATVFRYRFSKLLKCWHVSQPGYIFHIGWITETSVAQNLRIHVREREAAHWINEHSEHGTDRLTKKQFCKYPVWLCAVSRVQKSAMWHLQSGSKCLDLALISDLS